MTAAYGPWGKIVHTSGAEKIVRTSGAEKNVCTSRREILQISPRMLRGRFWLQYQDFGVSVGAIGIIFRDTSFPTILRIQNRLFRKIFPGVQGRRNGRGKKLLTLLGPQSKQVVHEFCEADLQVAFPRCHWLKLLCVSVVRAHTTS